MQGLCLEIDHEDFPEAPPGGTGSIVEVRPEPAIYTEHCPIIQERCFSGHIDRVVVGRVVFRVVRFQ